VGRYVFDPPCRTPLLLFFAFRFFFTFYLRGTSCPQRESSFVFMTPFRANPLFLCIKLVYDSLGPHPKTLTDQSPPITPRAIRGCSVCLSDDLDGNSSSSAQATPLPIRFIPPTSGWRCYSSIAMGQLHSSRKRNMGTSLTNPAFGSRNPHTSHLALLVLGLFN